MLYVLWVLNGVMAVLNTLMVLYWAKERKYVKWLMDEADKTYIDASMVLGKLTAERESFELKLKQETQGKDN